MSGSPDHRFPRWMAALAAAILCIAGLRAAPADRKAWDFNLPTLAGDRFVRVSALSGPVLVNFWGCHCPPCVEEMPRLQAFAEAHRDWTVLLVCTDAPQESRVFLQRHRITLLALRGGVDVTAPMRAAGNRDGALPFTVVLRDGAVIWTCKGGLTAEALAAVAASHGDPGDGTRQ